MKQGALTRVVSLATRNQTNGIGHAERYARYYLLACIGLGLALVCNPISPTQADHVVFLYSGHLTRLGQNPYPPLPLPNLNPPITLFAFAPLSLLAPPVAYWLLASLSILLYALTLRLLHRVYRFGLTTLFWTLALGGLSATIAQGQIYLPLVLATTLAWLALREGRSVVAGGLIGLVVAVKPNVAVWPFLLFVSGEVAVAAVAFVTFVVAWTLPVLAFGPAVYTQWLALSVKLSPSFLADAPNASLQSMAVRFALPGLGWPLAILLVIGCAALVRRNRDWPVEVVSGVGLTVALLASPVAWVGYTLLLLPCFLFRPWQTGTKVAAALLTFPWAPLNLLRGSALAMLTLGQIYLVALLLLLVVLIVPNALPTVRRDLPEGAV